MNQLQLNGQTAANAGALTGQANADAQALADQILANNAQGFPGAAGLQGQQSTDIGSQLAGTLPQDVVNQLDTQAAERGVSTGDPGGANNTAALLQALGLTSLSQVNQGESALNSALASNRVENPVAPVGLAPVGIAPIANPLGILGLASGGSSGGSGGGSTGTGTGLNPTAPNLPNLFPGLTPAAVPTGNSGTAGYVPNPVAPGLGGPNPATATAPGSIAALYPGNPGSDYGNTGYYGGTPPSSPLGVDANGNPVSVAPGYNSWDGNASSWDVGSPLGVDANGNPVSLSPDSFLTDTNYTAPTSSQPVDPYTGLPVSSTQASGAWDFSPPDSTTGGGFNLPQPTIGGGDTTVINGVAYDTATGQPVPGLMPTSQVGASTDSVLANYDYSY